jgi:hypothetical protein
MKPFLQDPNDSFDYATLTEVHNSAYDTPLGIILVAGWFLALAAAIIIHMVQKLDVGRRRTGTPTRLALTALVLLAGPILVSLVLEWTTHSGGKIPNALGYVTGAKTVDRDQEFSDWVKARYGVELTGPQVTEVQKRKNDGFMVPSNETHAILVNGALVHGLYAAGQIALVDDKGNEIPTVVR